MTFLTPYIIFADKAANWNVIDFINVVIKSLYNQMHVQGQR